MKSSTAMQWLVITIVVIGAFVAGFSVRGNSRDHADSKPAATTQTKQLWTCGMHPQVIRDAPGDCPICHMALTPLNTNASPTTSPSVTIDPVILQNMGVRVAPVVLDSVQREVRVVGYLEEPEPLHRDINLRVRGWIEKLHANVNGMPVEKGQPLFELYSPEIQVATNELITARRSLDGATDAQAKQMAQLLFDSTARKLELLGLEKQQVEALAKLDKAPETVTFVAPIGGHLTEKRVYEGAGVEAGTMLMRIANRHHMWVEAQVYEQRLPLVRIGSKAKVTIVSEPGKVYDGEVVFVHPHLDAMTRTATARIQIPNEDHHLRQGMYATVEILADPTEPAPVVPREAVIDTGTRQIVFVSLGGGHFEPREVKLGLAGDDGRVQVLEGVTPGEQVVTSGQFLLDSESRLKEAIQKHLSEGLASKPTPVAATSASSALNVPHTDEIVSTYLQIAETLGAKQESTDPVNVDALIAASQQATEHAAGEAKSLAQAVLDAATQMNGKSIADQRRAFMKVSDALVALLDRSPQAANVAPELYVAHCPMAFDDAGANWVQKTKSIANPYYATAMKSCGSIERAIPSKK
jgi:RND family efflux transporter MFP subunit